MKFVIEGRLDSLNKYIDACRSHRMKGAEMKKTNQEIVVWSIRKAKLKPVENYPVEIEATWYEPDNRQDIDNITFAIKYILDALVQEGILIDDSRKYVCKITHTVKTDKNHPHIEISLK